METDRGHRAVTDYTSHQLVEIILRGLQEAARDVDERRVPLDGRVRLLPEGPQRSGTKIPAEQA